eukprot:g5991.t1
MYPGSTKKCVCPINFMGTEDKCIESARFAEKGNRKKKKKKKKKKTKTGSNTSVVDSGVDDTLSRNDISTSTKSKELEAALHEEEQAMCASKISELNCCQDYEIPSGCGFERKRNAEDNGACSGCGIYCYNEIQRLGNCLCVNGYKADGDKCVKDNESEEDGGPESEDDSDREEGASPTPPNEVDTDSSLQPASQQSSAKRRFTNAVNKKLMFPIRLKLNHDKQVKQENSDMESEDDSDREEGASPTPPNEVDTDSSLQPASQQSSAKRRFTNAVNKKLMFPIRLKLNHDKQVKQENSDMESEDDSDREEGASPTPPNEVDTDSSLQPASQQSSAKRRFTNAVNKKLMFPIRLKLNHDKQVKQENSDMENTSSPIESDDNADNSGDDAFVTPQGENNSPRSPGESEDNDGSDGSEEEEQAACASKISELNCCQGYEVPYGCGFERKRNAEANGACSGCGIYCYNKDQGLGNCLCVNGYEEDGNKCVKDNENEEETCTENAKLPCHAQTDKLCSIAVAEKK